MGGAVQAAEIALNLSGEGSVASGVDKVAVNLGAVKVAAQKAEAVATSAEGGANKAASAAKTASEEAARLSAAVRTAEARMQASESGGQFSLPHVRVPRTLGGGGGLGRLVHHGGEALGESIFESGLLEDSMAGVGSALGLGFAVAHLAHGAQEKVEEQQKFVDELAEKFAEKAKEAVLKQKEKDVESFLHSEAQAHHIASQLGGVYGGRYL